MTAEQQRLLAPLSEYWDKLPEPRKTRLVEMAGRMEGKTPQEQERFQQGLSRFVTMQPDQRRQVRALFDRFAELPPQERQRVVDRVSTMSEEERGAFVLGMRVADRTHRFGGGVERFIRSLPAAERQSLMEELKALPPPEKLRRIADELEAQGFSGP